MTRLDTALVERGLARSRTAAQAAISAGAVTVNGRPAVKASQPVVTTDVLAADVDPWVSRAAHKLLGGLADSGLRVAGRVLDAGASTGGFTQVCLARGADRVYAVEVGHDQLAPAVRDDPRVVVWERTNLRDLTLEHVEGRPVDLIVADVSFISLRLLLPPLLSVLAPDGAALLLVKPQFEVGRGGLDDHGVVRRPALREQAVRQVCEAAAELRRPVTWRGPSRITGENGNQEYFVALGALGKVSPER
ncbi:MAG: TlyA family RNA methyltransferase [Propionicimonas sp.]